MQPLAVMLLPDDKHNNKQISMNMKITIHSTTVNYPQQLHLMVIYSRFE